MSSQEQLIQLPQRPGISLHTVISTTNQRSTAPTLVLLHWWGGSNRTYSNVISRLQSDYNIIAPTLRGWGQSSKPSDPGAYKIADDYAVEILDLIQSLQSSDPDLMANGIILVGHSMGGKIAQYLLTQPALKSMICRLVLIAPAPPGKLDLPAEMREQQIGAFGQVESARFVVENVLLAHPQAVSEEERVALANDAVAGCEQAKKAWPEYGMGEDVEGMIVEAVKGWERKPLKVLTVVGEVDRVETPEKVRKGVVDVLARAGADVKVVELDGVGHLIPSEAPDALAENIGAFAKQLT